MSTALPPRSPQPHNLPPHPHTRAGRLPVSIPARYLSTPPPAPPPQPTPKSTSSILNKLPPRLRPYATRLRNAPLSHITAFLILHEVTAIVPLGVIWWGLHAAGNRGWTLSLPGASSTGSGGEGIARGTRSGAAGEGGAAGAGGAGSYADYARGRFDAWSQAGQDRWGRYVRPLHPMIHTL